MKKPATISDHCILVLKKAGLLLLVLLTAGNCIHQNMRAAGMATHFAPLEDKPYKVLGEEDAVASNFNLFWVWSVTPPPNVELAILEAVNKKGGDSMIDIRLWREQRVWMVGTVHILHIRGKIIKYTERPDFKAGAK